jgi:hypothetical protein
VLIQAAFVKYVVVQPRFLATPQLLMRHLSTRYRGFGERRHQNRSLEGYHMGHIESLSEIVDALENYADSVTRRLRWWRGIVRTGVLLGALNRKAEICCSTQSR